MFRKRALSLQHESTKKARKIYRFIEKIKLVLKIAKIENFLLNPFIAIFIILIHKNMVYKVRVLFIKNARYPQKKDK